MTATAWPRERAWQLMTEWTASPALRAHMHAVELCMQHLAPRYDGDPAWWGVVGLLHDFDYERFPNADQAADAEHPSEGVRHLRTLGFPDEGCEAILGHAAFTGVPRVTTLAKVLFAVDELAGFLVACALVRPSKSLADLEAPSVLKKLKDKGFARGVSRDDVRVGAEELGVPLDALIRDLLVALRPHEQALGLGNA
ncbi:MAG: HAD family hydrolase [Gemmatimonadetes bacterium]|jgi:predicted hydrolase (HD superfamily)|nr:HAD family hydrolase [Gemmatimonadota bacterium]MBP6444448.1 HAD family hydrolase [Gemmatimonadales bacterium]MBP7622266.1 HAD family hydrolase [Gemmatimonadales bacterium]